MVPAATSSHLVGDWVGPRANLDVYGEEKNLLLLPEIESRFQKLYSYIHCSLQIVQKRN